jgi:hypothetical protein
MRDGSERRFIMSEESINVTKDVVSENSEDKNVNAKETGASEPVKANQSEDKGSDNKKTDNRKESKSGAGFRTPTTQASNTSEIAGVVVETITKSVVELARVSDVAAVTDASRRVFTTLMTMSSCDEFALGLKVDGELYRFSEFMVPNSLVDFVSPERVVARDVSSAKDLLKRSKFTAGLKESNLVNPSDFALCWKTLSSKIRVPFQMVQVRRDPVMLLADAVKYAVVGTYVQDRNISRILFLKDTYEDEGHVSIADWAKSFAAEAILTRSQGI